MFVVKNLFKCYNYKKVKRVVFMKGSYKKKKADKRKILIRVVAGFCAGLMLIFTIISAISLY